MLKKWILAACLCVLPAIAQSAGAPEVARFVREFYAWYVPIANRDSQTPAELIAIRERPEAFDPGLRAALEEDAKAAAASPDEIVGLDGDPFLNAQDFAPEYRTGAAVRVGRTWHVEVRGLFDGTMGREPDCVAVVEQAGGRLRFVDFRYSRGKTLRGVLKRLKQDRKKPVP